ncbi:hypothetical protein [Novosphingobium mathurense]|uniref:Uncharacterized protein n=1 Tax=Novosphingobium mathurense TaxID=428990 RepID=A0A1U6IVL4_9SPHN|nr:hypothetical protein [Novosphingobium mathurense]SLK12050.1 hypothetical protein SAMN06295987_11722 [Novosphingobium mathurense]
MPNELDQAILDALSASASALHEASERIEKLEEVIAEMGNVSASQLAQITANSLMISALLVEARDDADLIQRATSRASDSLRSFENEELAIKVAQHLEEICDMAAAMIVGH